MHEVLAHQRLVVALFPGLLGADQAEADELRLDQGGHLLLVFERGVAGPEQLVAAAEDAEHGVVDLALAGAEAAADRHGAGEVGVPAAVFGGHVQQHQLAGAAGAVVLDVVEDAVAGAAADDRQVGEAARPAADELVEQLGLDLPLADARADEPERPAEPGFGDLAGLAQHRDLGLVLGGPQPLHQRGQPPVAVERVAPPALADEAVVAGLDHHRGAQVLVGQQIDVVGLRHQRVEHCVEAVAPLDPLDAGPLAGLLLGQLLALPGGDLVVGLLDEQDLALPRVRGVRHHHQHRLLLVDAGQVVEVRVLAERHHPVGIGRADVVGMDDHDAPGLQHAAQALAVAGEEPRVDRVVAHGRIEPAGPAPDNAKARPGHDLGAGGGQPPRQLSLLRSAS